MTTKKFNILAPLSVGMVVITLGAAFGVLSGRGAFIGMISTCIITLFTALIGGSRYGVSSPTGPMTAAIAVILLMDQKWIESHNLGLDPVQLTNLTLIVSAVVLILLVLLRIHKLVKYVPNLVISGFVNGIAVLIAISQFKAMDKKEDWILMGITFVLAMLVSHFGKRFSHIAWRLIAGSFFLILILSFFTWILNVPVSYVNVESGLSSLALQIPTAEMLNFPVLAFVLPLAVELAFIGLLDTILTAVLMDNKTHTKTNFSRELTGQSASLLGVGLIGGIPGAQSTVPSMMMLQEGGHHRLSKLTLAAFCLLATFLLVDLIQFVPNAVFGGIILKIAYDVADFKAFKTILNSGSNFRYLQFFIVVGTLLSTVLISLNLAVICLTLYFILWNQILPNSLRIPDLTLAKESEGISDEL